jgi:hypothetical protein
MPEGLKLGLLEATRLPHMANRCVWTVRQKHEWMATPLKGKYLKLRKRTRLGMEAAAQRKVKPEKNADAN